MALTMPLLEGLDGVQKMSQSSATTSASRNRRSEMFGKLMSIPDELIAKYCAAVHGPRSREITLGSIAGLADGTIHPNDEKRRMARAVVETYHGEEAGGIAEDRFDRVYRDREVPQDVAEIALPADALRGTARRGSHASSSPPASRPPTGRLAGRSRREGCGSTGRSSPIQTRSCRPRTSAARCSRWAGVDSSGSPSRPDRPWLGHPFGSGPS